MNRRRFILNSAGLLVPFSMNCSRKKKRKTIIGPDEEEPESFEEVPYYEAEYSTGEGVSDSNGVVEIYSKKGLQEIKLVDDKNKSVGGLEVVLHEESKFGSNVFYVVDNDRKYMPNLFVPNVGKRAGLDTLVMYASKLFDKGKEIIVNKLDISNRIENSIPSHNPDRIDNVPGFAYMGDWSFNNLKEMNGVLQDGSAVISLLAPNPISSSAFGVLSKTGVVLNGIDTVVDLINEESDFEIDKDRKFPIYKPTLNTNNLTHLIFSLRDVKKSESYDIKELWPLQVGNWEWYTNQDFYQSGMELHKWEVESIEEINGKEHTRFFREHDLFYYGFKGNSLYYYGRRRYGHGYGKVYDMLEVPMKIGDDKIKVGDVYEHETKIISDHYSKNISLHMKITWEEKGDLVDWGRPYGNCIKAKIESNSGEDEYGVKELDKFNRPTYRWYSKNLGMVKGTVLLYNNLFDTEVLWERHLYKYELNSS